MAAIRPESPISGRRFSLLRTLGVGSFGSVYLADMESPGGFRRRVALKLLNATWDQKSDASIRLLDEARLLGRLHHRHIVRVDDLVRLDGRWALVMEFIDGIDLECVVTPPPGIKLSAMTERAALEIVVAVASALRAANEALDSNDRPLAVVHRDIKPSNIRVTASGDVKVLDFGIARADFVGREAKTEQLRYGSIGYMSPERLLGEAETSAGDVYALGVVLVELLSGTPYGRTLLKPAAQAKQVADAIQSLPAISTESLLSLARRMLSYEPDDRPSAQSVEEEARSLLAGRTEDDLAAWCALEVPTLAISAALSVPTVEGRVLTESVGAEPPVVSSPTLSQPPDVRDPTATNATIAFEENEDRTRVSGSWRMAGLAAVLTVAGLAAGLAYTPHPPPAGSPPPSPRVAATPASSATAPAAVEATAPPPPEPRVASAMAKPKRADEPTRPDEPKERLRAVKFALSPSTDRIDVTCGDVTSGGQGNALLQAFPAGSCTVQAGGLSTIVSVLEPRKVDCTLAPGTLTCR